MKVLVRALAVAGAWALLASIAPGLARADDSYANDQFGLKLKAPKGWTISKAKEADLGGLCDLSYGEGYLAGVLTRDDAEEGKSVGALADEDEATYKEGAKNFKRTKDEKLERTPGEWLLREFQYESAHGTKMFCATLYVKKDAHLFSLKLASGEELAKEEAAVKAVIDAFDLGGGAATSKGGATKGGEATKAPAKADGPTVDNPWVRWAEGSWVEFRIVSEMQGTATEMTQKQTLVGKTAEELTLKMEGKMSKPAAMDMPASETKVPARSPSGGGGGGAANVKELGKGDETLEIGGKKLACKWTESEVDSAGQKMTTKVWMSDDVPGGIVKSESKGAAMTSTMTLVSFEAKK